MVYEGQTQAIYLTCVLDLERESTSSLQWRHFQMWKLPKPRQEKRWLEIDISG